MYRVLIVDDEALVRQGLKSIIKWEHYGYEVCGEAKNGIEGLKKIDELKPHVIIADIKMPVMSGLKMIEELHKNKCKAKVILLTGYSDFTYAQSAIKYGVNAYILKPIKEIELIEKLKGIYTTIEYDNNKDKILENNFFQLKQKIIRGYILEQKEYEAIELCKKLYDFEFKDSEYQVILVGFNSNSHSSSEIYCCNVHDLIEKYVYDNTYGDVFQINGLSCILSRANSIEVLKKRYLMLKDKLNGVNYSITVSIGKPVDSLMMLKLSYRNALELLKRKFMFNNDSILDNDSLRYMMDKYQNLAEEFELSNIISKLYGAVEINNIEKINYLFECISSKMVIRNVPEEKIKQNFVNIFEDLLDELYNKYSQVLGEFEASRDDFINKLYDSKNLNELKLAIVEPIILISIKIVEDCHENRLKKLIDYVDNNYNSDLNLKILADMFGYNSTYLGTQFKAIAGENFNNYINIIRVENAKKLLEEGAKVCEVYKMVGYCSLDYFNKNFKKYALLSPGEYKQRNKK
jgi:two-component system response regulator YesN